MYLISACLCGVNCKYNGKNNLNEKFLKLLREGKVIPVCPEQLGGLTTPRAPAEILEDTVVTKEGLDITDAFKKGALETLRIAKEIGIKKAILKEGSPSCGCNFIYDGTFSGNKILGEGFTASLLKENGIEVVSDEQYLKEDDKRLIYLSDYEFMRNNKEKITDNNNSEIIYSLFRSDGEMLIDMPPAVEKHMKSIIVNLAKEILGMKEIADIADATGLTIEEVKKILDEDN